MNNWAFKPLKLSMSAFIYLFGDNNEVSIKLQ